MVERPVPHAILIGVAVAHVIARRVLDEGAIAMIVWNALALLQRRGQSSLPRAVARGRRTRLRWIPRVPVPSIEGDDDTGQWRPLEPFVLESRPWT